MAETVKEVVKLSELLECGVDAYDLANPEEKDEIIRIIFSELILTENTLQYKCKKGFSALASRFVSVSAERENRTLMSCDNGF